MPPAAIGPYTIERELGRGGMGEVFLARDTRLDRYVAIKALPAHVAQDANRLARFQREAKVLASLNHPGIGAIFGLEEASGNQYLILEYVEGETLADRLAKGPFPVEEALTLSRQIAEALEVAHEKGIVHRDLKPGNLILTPDGVIKVLDFGLARTADGAPSTTHAVVQADSPTILSPARFDNSPTIPGAIMGTAGYMSPEQARGKQVDKRSDIFSFGCVLFEMLSGVMPFPGETAMDSLGAILHRDPDWSVLPASTPRRIQELLANCLVKDRSNRLHDIADARLELSKAIGNREWLSTRASPAALPQRRAGVVLLPWLLASAAMLAAVLGIWRPWATVGPTTVTEGGAGAVRFQLTDQGTPPSVVAGSGTIAMSVDGRSVVYVGGELGGSMYLSDQQSGQGQHLVTRRLDTLQARIGALQPGHVLDPMFSPDARWIAYWEYVWGMPSSLYKVPFDGGAPIMLWRAPSGGQPKGGAWTNGDIIFCPAPNAGLLRVSDQGGTPETLTVPDAARGEISHRWPDVLPGGRFALITVKKAGILTFDDADIALLDLQTRTWKTIIRGGSYARYSPSGHIVFGRNGAIMAAPFDRESMTVTGSPIVVVPGVMTDPGSGAAQFAIAHEGSMLVYVPGGVDEPRSELVWVDWDGRIEPVGAPPMHYGDVYPSADGRRIVSTVLGATDAIFVYDVNTRTNTRIHSRGNCDSPIWMPDGNGILLRSDAEGPRATFMADAGGAEQTKKVLDGALGEAASLARVDQRDGVVFESEGDIWLQLLDDAAPRRLLESQFREAFPRVSPDGRWLSYTSDETGRSEVYIRPFPEGRGRRQVSRDGGGKHWWVENGTAIIYSDEDRVLHRVSIDTENGAALGSPERLTALPEGLRWPEPDPGGTRILALRDLPRPFHADRIVAVMNWFDELKEKVPAPSN